MVELLLRLMIIGRALNRLIAILLVGVLFTGCSTAVVVVEGTVPRPLVEPYPITVAVFFPESLKNYKLVDDGTGRNERSWEIDIGEAQLMYGKQFFQPCLKRWCLLRITTISKI